MPCPYNAIHLLSHLLLCFFSVRAIFDIYRYSSFFFFFLMIRRPPRSTLSSSSAASDVYKRQPPNYLLYQPPEDLPTRLFIQAMEKACGWTRDDVGMVAAELARDSLFAAMLTNPRCAVFSGEEAGAALVHYELTQSIWASSATRDVKGAAAYLSGHGEWILTRASLKYFRSNGWHYETNRKQLVSSLVSLMVTQPYGYHLLEDADIKMLCCSVGAVEDTLEWAKDPRSPDAPPGHEVGVRAVAAGAHPCIPPTKGERVAYRYPVTTGRYRYIVPPAIAAAVLLVAVTRNFMGGMFGGARQLPSATYENVAATVIWCALDALHRHSFCLLGNREQAGTLQVPAVLAFPSLADHFPVARERNKVPGEQVLFAMRPGEVHLMVPGADEGTDARIDDVVRAVHKKSMVLEMAGHGCPRNDLTIHNPGGVRMGFEFKSYRDSVAVRDDVLKKRCFHMGYNKFNRKQRNGHTHGDGVDSNMGQNLRGRYITLRTEALTMNKRVEPPPPKCEFLVLCGPRGHSLLRSDTSVHFTDRVHGRVPDDGASSVVVEGAQDPDASECRVVCMELGLEELLFRCAEKAPEEDSAARFASSEWYYVGSTNVITLRTKPSY
eukprot:TRINITY_DN4029_c0_g3_i1.p1 TRINITY_DN4029_c0_g3~~TRINITY_DN4029_c0_g3_i1.p1  ORF type:complete len:607 (-),score=65.41 TRINITY_DN4029_c0_g3_i1:143-1963(-)